MDLFLFGTLRHLPLLRVVSATPDIAHHLQLATAQGFAVKRAEGADYPLLRVSDKGVAEGLLLCSPDPALLERLDYYEGMFGYTRTEITVSCEGELRPAQVYRSAQESTDAAAEWDLGDWEARFGPMVTRAAQEAMAGQGLRTAREAGVAYPQMLTRAASFLRASQGRPRFEPLKPMTRDDVTVQDHRYPYAKFFSVEEVDLQYRQFDGTLSGTVDRAVFMGVDCAMVLPYDPVRDRVLVVEQIRPGAYLRGDIVPWTLEPVAGRIDPGETPEEAARREAMEEAGVEVSRLYEVAAAYPSPGTTSEYFFVYIGLCDLPEEAASLGGLASEDEDIRAHVLSWSAFEAALDAGDVNLLPLLSAGLWLARHRERIRADAGA